MLTCAVCQHAVYSVIEQDPVARYAHGQSFMLFCRKKNRPIMTGFGFGREADNSEYEELAADMVKLFPNRAPACEEVEPDDELIEQTENWIPSDPDYVHRWYSEFSNSKYSVLSAVSANIPSDDGLMSPRSLRNERGKSIWCRKSERNNMHFMVTAPKQCDHITYKLEDQIRTAWEKALGHQEHTGANTSAYYCYKAEDK